MKTDNFCTVLMNRPHRVRASNEPALPGAPRRKPPSDRWRGLAALAVLLVATFGSTARAAGAVSALPTVPLAADLTVSATVVAPAPERFGFNLQAPLLNNFTADPGFEPTVLRHAFVATGGGGDFIANDAGPTTSFFQTLTNGFFDGATVRVYRPQTSGPLLRVREGRVRNYAVNENRVYLDAVGPAVQAGDWYFLELLAANPPRDRVDPRMVFAAASDPWRPVGGSTWPFGLPVQVARDEAGVPPVNGGRSCLRLTAPGAHEVTVRQARFSSPASYGGYYPQLVEGRRYRIEVWLRQSGIPGGTARVFLTQHYQSVTRSFAIGEPWEHHSFTFVAPPTPLGTEAISEICLGFTGPGTLWADNLLLYEDDDQDPATYPSFAPRTEAVGAILDFHPGPVRLWAGQANTTWGTSLDSLTQIEVLQPNTWQADQGKVSAEFSWTLPTALPLVARAGGTPWIIVSPGFSESEWLGLVEYLAAPFDPTTDSPAGKPWAARRHAQGRTAPWTDAFERIRFEFGNETWNSLFQFTFPGGDLAGQFARYFFEVARSSPWFPSIAAKTDFIVNGWVLQPGPDGYGHAAARREPAARYSDLTAYLSGWELGSNFGSNVTDVAFQDMLLFPAGWLRYHVDRHLATREAMRSEGRDYRLAVYEGGPGYPLPGPGHEFDPVAEIYGKSLAAGTATLDAFLYQSLRGIDPQAYFTFQPGPNWSTHTNTGTAWRAHPSWLALQLRNQFASGGLVNVALHQTPFTSIPASNQDGNPVPALADVPLLAAHAFHDPTRARFTVFLLSRDLTRPVDVTLRLPFDTVARTTRHGLSGDPRTNNISGANVVASSVELTDFAPVSRVSVPPGTVVVLEYESAVPRPETGPAVVISRAVGQPERTEDVSARFRVHFSQPVTGFSAADVVTGGPAAAATTVQLSEVFPNLGTDFEVTVSGVTAPGALTVTVPPGAGTNATGQGNLTPLRLGADVTFVPPTVSDRLRAWDGFEIEPAGGVGPVPLQNASGGFGWARGWDVQNFDVAYTGGYRIAPSPNLGPATLRQTGGHGVGGRRFEAAGRGLAVDTAFAELRVPGSEPARIGRDGRSLWISAILRKDTAQWNSEGPFLHLVDDVYAWNLGAARFALGYFGAASVANGTPYWSLGVRHGAGTGFTVVRSPVPIVLGQAALLVARVTFGTPDRIELYVNPAALGGEPPADPQAVWHPAGAGVELAFRTVGLYGGPSLAEGVVEGRFDEIRLGDTFAAVTPVAGWTFADWRSRWPWAVAEAGLPTADPDADGRVNLEEYATGGDPLVPDTRSGFTAGMVDGRIRVSWPQDVRAEEVLCRLESSIDLRTWTPLVTSRSVGGELRREVAPGAETVTVAVAGPRNVFVSQAIEEVDASLTADSRRYFRLRLDGL